MSSTSPSTPAVRRPALRSVTRRTLTSVFERDRSINFCDRRTLWRSPAPLAVKIHCRNRRTFRSARRQSTWRRSSISSSRPLTTTCAVASSLLLGFRDHVVFLLRAHLTASAPFRAPATRGRCSAGSPRPPARRTGDPVRFPVAFRPPALASRSSFSRRESRPSSRSAYRPHDRTSNGVTSVPHIRAATGEGALCAPGTVVLIPTEATSRPAPAASLRPVPCPRQPSHRRGCSLNEASTKGSHVFARPVFPSPVAARMEQAALGLCPELRTPPTRSRTTHVGAGTGHRARTWNCTLNSHSVDLLSGSSLVMCDLASHVANQ